jgi:FtsH-binding integral membrane protein
VEAGTAGATESSAYLEKAEAAMRLSFMRKVYSILLMQLLATIGMACLFMFEPSANSFVLSSPRLLIVGLVLSFVTLIALIWCVLAVCKA